MDLKKYIGARFGRLEIIGVDKNKKWHVICKCQCGIVKSIKIYSILRGATTSCGCYHKEQVFKKLVPLTKNCNYKAKIKAGISRIKNGKSLKRNKTGVTGVCFIKEMEIYRSYININGKRIYLGDYKNLNEAIIARKGAEKKALKILAKEMKKVATK